MSNSNDIRSDLGLVNLVKELMSVRKNRQGLFDDWKTAEKKYEKNMRDERCIREELANHILAVSHNEIIILPEVAVHVSLKQGADQATMDFLHPRS